MKWMGIAMSSGFSIQTYPATGSEPEVEFKKNRKWTGSRWKTDRDYHDFKISRPTCLNTGSETGSKLPPKPEAVGLGNGRGITR